LVSVVPPAVVVAFASAVAVADGRAVAGTTWDIIVASKLVGTTWSEGSQRPSYVERGLTASWPGSQQKLTDEDDLNMFHVESAQTGKLTTAVAQSTLVGQQY